MKVLIIAPQYDVPTTISSQAVYELMNWLTEKKIEYAYLLGPAAYRGVLEVYANDYDLICYFGHGIEDALIGAHAVSSMFGFNLLDLNNAERIKPKVIYTMACLSGVKLGPLFGKLGVTYFGHTAPYFAAFTRQNHDYFQDWKNYVTLIPKLLVQGEKPSTAYGHGKALLSEYIREYSTEKYEDWEWHVDSATSNRDFAKLFGPNDALVSD